MCLLVTEDYSSYESVDEETEDVDAAEASTKKGRSAKAKQTQAGSKLKPKESKEETRLKPSEPTKRAAGAKAGGQGKIMNFFGKK